MKLLYQLVFSILITFYHAKAIPEKFINKENSEKTCECVPFILCENGTEIIDGAGLIDKRSNYAQTNKEIRSTNVCENILEVCCEPPNIKHRKKKISSIISSQMGERGCGIRNFNGVGSRITNQGKNEAKFGEFPWMVAVLHNTVDKLDVYKCGGALIHRKVVLTVAHCLDSRNTSVIKIRAGEWDTQSTIESFPHQDRGVEAIVIHENYDPRSLRNDFALLILSNPVNIAQNVDIICLSESNNDYDFTKCTATGWGKDKHGKGGQHQEILKKVELSMVSPYVCQSFLRRTRLGTKFELDKSFICAGGVKGEDTCKGDGGSPLICPLKTNPKRYVQVGIVSWGIGCGSNLPGVYASISYARPWIDEQMMFHNLDNDVYRYESYTEDTTY